jgi:hypothetical protein
MRGLRTIIGILTLLAAACGGGGPAGQPGGAPSTSGSPPAPPASQPGPNEFVLQYPGPQVFNVGVLGSSDVPALNYTGSNSISVTPTLPVGLEIDANSGVISGTPAAVTSAASYAITVSNDLGGAARTSVVIEVNDGPFFYASPDVLAAGSAMTPLSPRGASGTASYTVTPPLPAGLSIDPATGVISGIPTSAQPATYYQVSRVEALLTLKFGLTLGVGIDVSGPISVSNASTLFCAYSGGFVGTYTGDSQANDEGLIAIAFTPDGNAHARVLDLSDNAVYDSDGLTGLSASLDGSFDINLPGSSGGPARQLHGKFSGADLISGTYQSGGIVPGAVAKPFIASRLAGSPAAGIRFTGGFGSSGPYRVDFGVLDVSGATAVGIGYQFGSVGSDYRLINRQLAIQGTFNGNTFDWLIPDDGISGVDTLSSTGLELAFGDPYEALFFAKTLGCRLN